MTEIRLFRPVIDLATQRKREGMSMYIIFFADAGICRLGRVRAAHEAVLH